MSPQPISIAIPVGSYRRYSVEPPCGLVDRRDLIGDLDRPDAFLAAGRLGAQLLWFQTGFVEYAAPLPTSPAAGVQSVEFTAELCSDAPGFKDDCPSDITVWLNGVELGAWTSPGDFGGRRGRLTPSWWSVEDSQFGLLVSWKVTSAGTVVSADTTPARRYDATIADLRLSERDDIVVRVGVRPDSASPAGINMFGRQFGDHEVDPTVTITYE
jgi:predicted transcriptional regulator